MPVTEIAARATSLNCNKHSKLHLFQNYVVQTEFYSQSVEEFECVTLTDAQVPSYPITCITSTKCIPKGDSVPGKLAENYLIECTHASIKLSAETV